MTPRLMGHRASCGRASCFSPAGEGPLGPTEVYPRVSVAAGGSRQGPLGDLKAGVLLSPLPSPAVASPASGSAVCCGQGSSCPSCSLPAGGRALSWDQGPREPTPVCGDSPEVSLVAAFRSPAHSTPICLVGNTGPIPSHSPTVGAPLA